jgi:hypothetical protein
MLAGVFVIVRPRDISLRRLTVTVRAHRRGERRETIPSKP